MRRQLVIIGASGHGKVVADCAVKNGYEKIVFLDDNANLKHCGKFPVIGKSSDVARINGDVIIAIGNAALRQSMQDCIDRERLVTLVHPNAVISGAAVGVGTVIMAGAIINPGTVIGEGCIINTASSIDHDCRIGDFVHVSIGSHIAGTVEIQNRTWIGAGAIVSNNISICSDCMIGAGAVVVKNISAAGIYVGVPARKKTAK